MKLSEIRAECLNKLESEGEAQTGIGEHPIKPGEGKRKRAYWRRKKSGKPNFNDIISYYFNDAVKRILESE